jgi:hypothetical protein
MDEEEQPCKNLKTLLGLLGHDDSNFDEEEENNTLSIQTQSQREGARMNERCYKKGSFYPWKRCNNLCYILQGDFLKA